MVGDETIANEAQAAGFRSPVTLLLSWDSVEAE